MESQGRGASSLDVIDGGVVEVVQEYHVETPKVHEHGPRVAIFGDSILVTKSGDSSDKAMPTSSPIDARVLPLAGSGATMSIRPTNGLLRANLQRQGLSIPEWTLSDKGWIKINFDGASRGNPGPSGVGVIARDVRGNTLAIGAKRLVDGTNNVAKCQAALEAILMAGKLGVKKLHLEGDSQVVVNGIA
ncbi:uncharacterized protein LOC131857025 [Cryptomeria japonica]|uniref:uncharacterized protein LOC131857025 n=1 Tax=Cryptomeria japonica TaxID=3369 RepID=UPI0027DA91D6|nr:uncharacterized protein LOC131857025 [Cryptomeria japonica]